MIISTQKIKTIVINKAPTICKIEIDGKSIEQVPEHKIIKLWRSGRRCETLNSKINKIDRCFHSTIGRNKQFFFIIYAFN